MSDTMQNTGVQLNEYHNGCRTVSIMQGHTPMFAVVLSP